MLARAPDGRRVERDAVMLRRPVGSRVAPSASSWRWSGFGFATAGAKLGVVRGDIGAFDADCGPCALAELRVNAPSRRLTTGRDCWIVAEAATRSPLL
jgi:hypothetical protein